MRKDRGHATPMLPPLRMASNVLDEVELDLATFQKDLVLAERAGIVALTLGGVAVVGFVALLVARSLRRRRIASDATAARRAAAESAAATATAAATAAAAARRAANDVATATVQPLDDTDSDAPQVGR